MPEDTYEVARAKELLAYYVHIEYDYMYEKPSMCHCCGSFTLIPYNNPQFRCNVWICRASNPPCGSQYLQGSHKWAHYHAGDKPSQFHTGDCYLEGECKECANDNVIDKLFAVTFQR